MDDESVPIFLKPGVNLMNKLNFVWKFSFVSIFLLFPLFVLGIALVNEVQRSIHTIEQEQAGLDVLVSTYPVFFAASSYRDYAIVQRIDLSEGVAKEIKQRQEKVSHHLERLKQAIEEKPYLNIGTHLQNLEASWQALNSNTPGGQGGPNIQYQYYNTFVDAVDLFIRTVAYESQLVHDPDLSTFFLINLILRELPDVSESMGSARAYGNYALHLPSLDYETYKTLDKIYDSLLKNVDAHNRSLALVLSQGLSMETTLKEAVKATQENLNGSADYFYQELIETDFINITWADYDLRLKGTFEELEQLVSLILPIINRKLEERLYWNNVKLWGSIISASILLLITAYLFAAVFYSISKLIREFTTKAKLVAAGDWSVGLNHDTDDEFTGLYMAFNEMVSQLKENQQQLLDAEKMASMGSMITGMAHEMNTPIGIAQTSSNLISEDINRYLTKYHDGSITRDDFENMMKGSIEGLQLIERNLQRCTTLIDTLKQLNIYQSASKVHEIDIYQLLEATIQNLELAKRYPDVNVILNCDKDCRWIADPDLISLVMKSILSNALNHGLNNNDDTLTICAVNEGEKLSLSVQDQGTGVEKEHIDKIINPFYTTKRHAGHVGLGLHIAYVVTTQTLNGSFKVDSEFGEGTKITLELFKEKPASTSAEVPHIAESQIIQGE